MYISGDDPTKGKNVKMTEIMLKSWVFRSETLLFKYKISINTTSISAML